MRHHRAHKKPIAEHYPLKLKGVLVSLGISQAKWAACILQTGGYAKGKRLSRSAAESIVRRNIWPTLTPREHIMAQTEAMLRGLNVPKSTLKTIWEEDVLNEHRHKHPAGCHTTSGRRQPPSVLDQPLKEVVMLTATARKSFALFRDPFTDDVQGADDVFLSAEYRYVCETMYNTAKHGGFLAVVGESGAGKTTLRRDLIDRINRERGKIVIVQPKIIDKGRLTAGLICEAIVRDLSQQKPRQTLEGKARQVEEILIGSCRTGNSHVLVIEEAQDLPVSTLKYLKRFWELEDGFKKLLAIILVGQPELKAKLDERQNYAAREVIRRCEVVELPPLDDHLEEYLNLKFKRIGKSARDIFEKDAFDAIRAKLTLKRRGGDGSLSLLYPLVVNNLVVKAINAAAEIGAKKISADIIKEI
jgi:type II secretory pathway predicted ATPase ExeA